jgi:sec-independent protein translocase protein TatA
MGFGSIWHWVIVLVVVLLLFGAGKIPRLMGDMAKGVKAFKEGLKDGDEKPSEAAAQPAQPAQPTEPPKVAQAETVQRASDPTPTNKA